MAIDTARHTENNHQHALRAIVDIDLTLFSKRDEHDISYHIEDAKICNVGPGPAINIEVYFTPLNGQQRLIWRGILAGSENYFFSVSPWSYSTSDEAKIDIEREKALKNDFHKTSYFYEVRYIDCFGNAGYTHGNSKTGDGNDMEIYLHLPEIGYRIRDIAPRTGIIRCRAHTSSHFNIEAGQSMPKCKKKCIFEYIPTCEI